MRLPIANCRLPIGQSVLPLVLLVVTASSAAFAQSRPADTQAATSIVPRTHAVSPNVPITFARSGRKVTVELMTVNFPHKEFVLRAFGRIWSSPVPLKDLHGPRWLTEFDVPAVRVPTVFAITPIKPVDAPQTVLGEVVVYPDRDVEWDKKITLYSCAAPGWFNQWAAATGLPVQWGDEKTPATLPALRPDERCLLVMGSTRAGKSYDEFPKKWQRPPVNILLLEAQWMQTWGTALELTPVHMQGPLASLNVQRWAKPLVFSDFSAANRILCNRWSLVDQVPVPPLEVVGDIHTGPWVALSGIRWPEQLGRREEADVLLLEVLKATATFAPKVETIRQGTLVYPEKVVYDPKTMGYCPALACITNGEGAAGAPRVLIVDLRGPQPVPADLLDRLAAQVKNLGHEDRLLLIGDDPVLDQWEWLKIDREKKITNRPGVNWLEDDQSWDKTYEIPVMLKLTELGVPLAPPEQKEMGK